MRDAGLRDRGRRGRRRGSGRIGGGLPGVEQLLSTAVARFDPRVITGSNPVTEWNNRGTGGAAYDLDVVVGTAANLTTLESGVALLTGTAGDYLSTPDSAAASITGDLELIFKMASSSYAMINQTVLAVDDAYVVQLSRAATLSKSLSVIIYQSASGKIATSSVALSTNDGEEVWGKINLVVATGKVNFSTSPDGSTWAALGTEQSITAASTDDGSDALAVGASSGGLNPFFGLIYRAQVYSGIDGTLAVDCDPSKATVNTATFVTDTGETWTINGNAFVNATNYTGIYSRGSVGLETTAGQTIGSPATVFAVFKPTLAAPAANAYLYDARSDVDARMAVFTNEPGDDKYTVFQGGASLTLSEAYDNDLRVITFQANDDATSKGTVSDVGSVTGDSGSDDWDFGSIFMRYDDTSAAQGLFLEFIVFDSALPATKVTQIQNYLAGKYA